MRSQQSWSSCTSEGVRRSVIGSVSSLTYGYVSSCYGSYRNFHPYHRPGLLRKKNVCVAMAQRCIDKHTWSSSIDTAHSHVTKSIMASWFSCADRAKIWSTCIPWQQTPISKFGRPDKAGHLTNKSVCYQYYERHRVIKRELRGDHTCTTRLCSLSPSLSSRCCSSSAALMLVSRAATLHRHTFIKPQRHTT